MTNKWLGGWLIAATALTPIFASAAQAQEREGGFGRQVISEARAARAERMASEAPRTPRAASPAPQADSANFQRGDGRRGGDGGDGRRGGDGGGRRGGDGAGNRGGGNRDGRNGGGGNGGGGWRGGGGGGQTASPGPTPGTSLEGGRGDGGGGGGGGGRARWEGRRDGNDGDRGDGGDYGRRGGRQVIRDIDRDVNPGGYDRGQRGGDGRYNGRRDGRYDGRRDGGYDGRRDGRYDGRRDGRYDGQRDGRTDGGRYYGRTDGGRYDRGDRQGGWNHDWRRDTRYNWQNHRARYRNIYRLPAYYSPYRDWNYRRISVGFSLGSLFYGERYWINDPWYYRLPEAYGQYRWVRYYDDALLIDLRSGQVVDTIYDVFWN